MIAIYIAGAYRAPTPWLVECNIRRAEEVALTVAKLGAVPLCVHSMFRFFDKALPDEFWIQATRELMRRCDAVVIVPVAELSAGTRAEWDEALKLKIPVLEADAWEFEYQVRELLIRRLDGRGIGGGR